MSKSHLEGRQAENNLDRPDTYVLGGFEDDGRQVVKRNFKSGKAADKPEFFMGGCGPTVPTGPKRKLRTSWLANGSSTANDNNNSDKPGYVEHVPKPVKKWTPVAKKKLPPRCKSHDGTMNAAGSVRKGRKPSPFEKKEEKKEEDEVVEESPKEEKEEEVKDETVAEEAEKEEREKEEPIEADEEDSYEEDVEDLSEEDPTPEPPKPAWEPPKVHIRKAIKPTEDDQKEFHNAAEAAEEGKTPSPSTSVPGEPCSECASKDEEIDALKEEIAKLKEEKGELAKALKKTKGSQAKNVELKEEVLELKEQLSKANKADANSKGFHKLENKLNTLKMIMDGSVNKNSLDDLQDHVNMLNMIINQDLKTEGMKNVWA